MQLRHPARTHSSSASCSQWRGGWSANASCRSARRVSHVWPAVEPMSSAASAHRGARRMPSRGKVARFAGSCRAPVCPLRHVLSAVTPPPGASPGPSARARHAAGDPGAACDPGHQLLAGQTHPPVPGHQLSAQPKNPCLPSTASLIHSLAAHERWEASLIHSLAAHERWEGCPQASVSLRDTSHLGVCVWRHCLCHVPSAALDLCRAADAGSARGLHGADAAARPRLSQLDPAAQVAAGHALQRRRAQAPLRALRHPSLRGLGPGALRCCGGHGRHLQAQAAPAPATPEHLALAGGRRRLRAVDGRIPGRPAARVA
eukprot:scaffold77060_cov69-Phaeocystis_antarctica.AAC.3